MSEDEEHDRVSTRITAIAMIVFGWSLAYWMWPDIRSNDAIGWMTWALLVAAGSAGLAAIVW